MKFHSQAYRQFHQWNFIRIQVHQWNDEISSMKWLHFINEFHWISSMKFHQWNSINEISSRCSEEWNRGTGIFHFIVFPKDFNEIEQPPFHCFPQGIQWNGEHMPWCQFHSSALRNENFIDEISFPVNFIDAISSMKLARNENSSMTFHYFIYEFASPPDNEMEALCR